MNGKTCNRCGKRGLEWDLEFHKKVGKWKLENPNQHVKDIKEQYILGEIENLPWAKDLTGYIMKNTEGDQVKISYVQNEEQNENSIWQKIKDDQN